MSHNSPVPDRSPVRLSRRRALTLAAVAVGGVAAGGLGTARGATATDVVSLGPATVLRRDPEPLPYRAVRVADPADLLHFPAGAKLRWWDPSWTYLQQGFAACSSDEVLVLPERSAPYLIDARGGFSGGGGAPLAMMKRGLVGLGPGVVVQPSSTSWSRGPQTSALPNDSLLCTSADGAFFGNLELRGGDFGGFAYNGVRMFGNGAVVANVYFNAAHRGFKNSPPGETGAVNNWRGSDQLVVNCEVECRDSAGKRVATSPFMFNRQSRVAVTDCYGHHSFAGMPTFYMVTDAATTRLRSEHNGSGQGSVGRNGHGFNHEQCSGTIVHRDPTILIDYHNPINDGLHLSYGSNTGSVGIRLINPKFDQGPVASTISVQMIGTKGMYTPFVEPRFITAVTSAGSPIPVRIHRPA